MCSASAVRGRTGPWIGWMACFPPVLLCSCTAPTKLDRPVRDYHPGPFHHLVILGESTVAGGGWLAGPSERYADVLVKLINRVQETPVAYDNRGIGANVISTKSPGYEASRKPSAMERYQADVIDLKPDLFILAYGLNDMRAGMDVDIFIEEMETIVRDVQAACQPLIVLANVYHMTRYDAYPPFDRGGIEATIRYNNAIRRLAERTGSLYADVYSAENRADWIVHPDGVHANAVGNLLIAHKIFEVLATHCSGLAAATQNRDRSTAWTETTRRMRQEGRAVERDNER